MLTQEGCLARRQRMLRVMEEKRWDLFLTANPRTIYYSSGKLAEPPVAYLLWADGREETVEGTFAVKKAARCGVERRWTPGLYEDGMGAVEDATAAVLRSEERRVGKECRL